VSGQYSCAIQKLKTVEHVEISFFYFVASCLIYIVAV